MNIPNFVKEYGLMLIIFLLMLIFVPPMLAQYLGALGVYAGYVATGIVLIAAFWLNKKVQESKAVRDM